MIKTVPYISLEEFLHEDVLICKEYGVRHTGTRDAPLHPGFLGDRETDQCTASPMVGRCWPSPLPVIRLGKMRQQKGK